MLRWRTVVAVMLVAFAFASRSDAQDVARSFDDVRFRVGAGDTVYISDSAGHEQKARVLEISSSTLSVSVAGTRRDLSEQDVAGIRQRLPDPLRNGAVIGTAAGVGVTLALFSAGVEDCSAVCWSTGIAFYSGIGALIGTGIDALIKGRKPIYAAADRGLSARVRVRPLLRSGEKGLSLSVQF